MDCNTCPNRLACLHVANINPKLCAAVMKAMLDILQEATRRKMITNDMAVELSSETIIRNDYEEIRSLYIWIAQLPNGDWGQRDRMFKLDTEDPDVGEKVQHESW